MLHSDETLWVHVGLDPPYRIAEISCKLCFRLKFMPRDLSGRSLNILFGPETNCPHFYSIMKKRSASTSVVIYGSDQRPHSLGLSCAGSGRNMLLLEFEEFFYPEQVIESAQTEFRSECSRRRLKKTSSFFEAAKSCPVIGECDVVTWRQVVVQYNFVSTLSLFADTEEVVPERRKALKMWTSYSQMTYGDLADGAMRRSSV